MHQAWSTPIHVHWCGQCNCLSPLVVLNMLHIWRREVPPLTKYLKWGPSKTQISSYKPSNHIIPLDSAWPSIFLWLENMRENYIAKNKVTFKEVGSIPNTGLLSCMAWFSTFFAVVSISFKSYCFSWLVVLVCWHHQILLPHSNVWKQNWIAEKSLFLC